MSAAVILRQRLAVLGLTGLLAGCAGWTAVPAERVALPEIAPSWTQGAGEPSGEAPAAAWWAAFADPMLPELVAEAWRSNPGLKAAQARVQEGEGAEQVAGAGRLPSVDASYQASRSQAASGSGAVVISERHALNVALAWEVDVWGRVSATADAATADVAALRMDLQAARLSLAAAVARAWFDLIEARGQIRLSETLVENLSAHLEALNRGYARGLFGAADLALAQSNLAAERARLADRQRLLGDRLRALELLLGRYPAAALSAPAVLPALPAPVPAGLPADLLQRRADIVAAGRRAFAAELRQDAAHDDRFPRLTLTASAGHSSPDLADLLTGRRVVWNLLAGVVQPLVDGGRREGAEAQAAARLTQAESRYVETVLQAFSEVEGALEQERRLHAQIEALSASAAAARRAETLSGEQFQAGIESTLAMLEVKRRSVTTQSALLDAQLRQLKNRINLHLALGGGFDVPAQPPTRPDLKMNQPPKFLRSLPPEGEVRSFQTAEPN